MYMCIEICSLRSHVFFIACVFPFSRLAFCRFACLWASSNDSAFCSSRKCSIPGRPPFFRYLNIPSQCKTKTGCTYDFCILQNTQHNNLSLNFTRTYCQHVRFNTILELIVFRYRQSVNATVQKLL